jgi:nucleotide-binding universal stress UspA family protein
MPGKVVVGYIDTQEGQAAVEAAIDESLIRQATLILVNSAWGAGREDSSELIAMSAAVEAARSKIEARGVECHVHELVRGNDPAQDILDVAASEAADLIVIGVRRRSPVGKLILGSNSQTILLQADCPVLAVKP